MTTWHRRISARSTILQKFVPHTVTVVLGVLSAFFLVNPAACAPTCSSAERVGWVATIAILGPLAWLATRRLKRVALEDGVLVISNYLRTIRVPFTNVKSVHEHGFPYAHASIEFAEPTPFGRRVTFIPVDISRRQMPGEHCESVLALKRLAMQARQVDVEKTEQELRLMGR